MFYLLYNYHEVIIFKLNNILNIFKNFVNNLHHKEDEKIQDNTITALDEIRKIVRNKKEPLTPEETALVFGAVKKNEQKYSRNYEHRNSPLRKMKHNILTFLGKDSGKAKVNACGDGVRILAVKKLKYDNLDTARRKLPKTTMDILQGAKRVGDCSEGIFKMMPKEY